MESFDEQKFEEAKFMSFVARAERLTESELDTLYTEYGYLAISDSEDEEDTIADYVLLFRGKNLNDTGKAKLGAQAMDFLDGEDE